MAPPEEIRRLECFLGSWRAEGESKPSAPIPGPLTAADTYEWFPGGHFLVDQGELHVIGHPRTPHLWVFGYDPERAVYPIHAFDADGHFRQYEATVHDRIWAITGQWERGTLEFDARGDRYTARWEFTKDGKTWLPLCEMAARRVAAPRRG